jgi:hypothetical protein
MKFYCLVCKESYELKDFEKGENVYLSVCPQGHKVARVIGGEKKVEVQAGICSKCGLKIEDCTCEDEDFI